MKRQINSQAWIENLKNGNFPSFESRRELSILKIIVYIIDELELDVHEAKVEKYDFKQVFELMQNESSLY